MSRAPVLAVLQAAATETLYGRAGDGPSILLLTSGLPAGPPGGELFAELARQARVLAPVLPRGGATGDPAHAALASWLGEVCEGLGLERPTVVLDEALVVLLTGALASIDAFAGVVVLVAPGDDAEARARRLAARGACPVPAAHGDVAAIARAVCACLPRDGDGR